MRLIIKKKMVWIQKKVEISQLSCMVLHSFQWFLHVCVDNVPGDLCPCYMKITFSLRDPSQKNLCGPDSISRKTFFWTVAAAFYDLIAFVSTNLSKGMWWIQMWWTRVWMQQPFHMIPHTSYHASEVLDSPDWISTFSMWSMLTKS